MKPTLLKIEDRGAGLAAIFQSDRAGGQPVAYTAESLAVRIGNLETSGLDASVERDALAQIKRTEQR